MVPKMLVSVRIPSIKFEYLCTTSVTKKSLIFVLIAILYYSPNTAILVKK